MKNEPKEEKVNAPLILFGIMMGFFILFYFFFKSDYPKDPNIKYEFYGEEYTYFGDGRFQVQHFPTDPNRVMLIDEMYADSWRNEVALEIEKYYLAGRDLYVSGDFGPGGTSSNKEGIVSYSGTINTETGDVIRYKSQEDIPKYLILNIETGDVEYFITTDTMTPEQRAIFEIELDKTCLQERTCYKAGILQFKGF